MTNCDNYAIDSHIYQAWAWENTAEWFQEHACEDKMRLVEMEALGILLPLLYLLFFLQSTQYVRSIVICST